jgi:hypothetical protein
MNDNNNSDLLPRGLIYQRRSVSVGDTPFLMAVDDQYETQDIEQTTNDDQYIKPGNADDYICTPLPRTNHRPTASTCWLVFFYLLLFSSVSNPFPINKIDFDNKKASSSVEYCRFKFCFFIIDKKKLFGFYIEPICCSFFFFSFDTLLFALIVCLYARTDMFFYRRAFIYLNIARREISITKKMTSSLSNPVSRRSISMSADSSQTR